MTYDLSILDESEINKEIIELFQMEDITDSESQRRLDWAARHFPCGCTSDIWGDIADLIESLDDARKNTRESLYESAQRILKCDYFTSMMVLVALHQLDLLEEGTSLRHAWIRKNGRAFAYIVKDKECMWHYEQDCNPGADRTHFDNSWVEDSK